MSFTPKLKDEAQRFNSNENSKSLTRKIYIDDIVEPKFHDRRYVEEDSIKDLADSINKRGLLSPITVRKVADNKYERIIGSRRVAACKYLGLVEITAIVVENTSSNEAFLMMLTENLQREDLNPFDEVDSLIRLISHDMNIEKETIKSIIKRIAIKIKNKRPVPLEDEQFQIRIEQLLKKVSNFTIVQLREKMKIYNFNKLILADLEKGRISYKHANIVSKLSILKDDSIIENVLKKVKSNKLSSSKTEKIVKKLLGENKENPKTYSFKSTDNKLIINVDKTKFSDEQLAELKKLEEYLLENLKKIESLKK